MKAWLIPTLVCGLISVSTSAFAQNSTSSSSWAIDSVVPASFSSSDRVVVASANTLDGSSDNALPTPLSAAPPPEPGMPSWGQYLAPSTAPAAPLQREYTLVGPPRGTVQNIEGQDYNAVISDPDVMLGDDTQIGQTINIYRPDGMAPIGMFGDHALPAGAAFISYRYLQNSFDQNYNGSHRVGVPTSYPFAPTRGLQDSQVALVEYGVTQDLTVMAFLPFQHNEINSQTATGSYQTAFTNPGDIRIMALIVLGRGDRSQQHLNLGMSLPVGFLEQQTTFGTTPTPSPTFPNLPYQIRTSSGTYDMLFGYTYRKQTDNWTWGGQLNAVVPTGKNTLGYELANQFQSTTWLSRRWSERWSTSARLDAHFVGNIRGADGRLDPTLSPANQTNTQASRTLNGLLGVNYLLTCPGHRIQEQRLFLESGIPLYQWVDGPQLGLSWILNAGWGMTF